MSTEIGAGSSEMHRLYRVLTGQHVYLQTLLQVLLGGCRSTCVLKCDPPTPLNGPWLVAASPGLSSCCGTCRSRHNRRTFNPRPATQESSSYLLPMPSVCGHTYLVWKCLMVWHLQVSLHADCTGYGVGLVSVWTGNIVFVCLVYSLSCVCTCTGNDTNADLLGSRCAYTDSLQQAMRPKVR